MQLSPKDPRHSFRTTCPASTDGDHAWIRDAAACTRTVERFGCFCGARGWKQIRSDPHAKPMHDAPIHQYQMGSEADRKPMPRTRRVPWTVRPKLGPVPKGDRLSVRRKRPDGALE